jgi:hypothetical protein
MKTSSTDHRKVDKVINAPLRLELATGPGSLATSRPLGICSNVLKLVERHTPIDVNSQEMMVYDFLGFALILFTAVVTPYEIAFLQTPKNSSEIDGLWSFNRVVDAYFIFDMFFNFVKPVRVNIEVVTFIPGTERRNDRMFKNNVSKKKLILSYPMFLFVRNLSALFSWLVCFGSVQCSARRSYRSRHWWPD